MVGVEGAAAGRQTTKLVRTRPCGKMETGRPRNDTAAAAAQAFLDSNARQIRPLPDHISGHEAVEPKPKLLSPSLGASVVFIRLPCVFALGCMEESLLTSSLYLSPTSSPTAPF